MSIIGQNGSVVLLTRKAALVRPTGDFPGALRAGDSFSEQGLELCLLGGGDNISQCRNQVRASGCYECEAFERKQYVVRVFEEVSLCGTWSSPPACPLNMPAFLFFFFFFLIFFFFFYVC